MKNKHFKKEDSYFDLKEMLEAVECLRESHIVEEDVWMLKLANYLEDRYLWLINLEKYTEPSIALNKIEIQNLLNFIEFSHKNKPKTWKSKLFNYLKDFNKQVN